MHIFFPAGVAFSNSTHYYGWKPQRELVFRYESSVDSSIPEIKTTQKAGLRLTSTVRIQTYQDYSIGVKMENPRFVTFNGDEMRSQQEEPIPAPLLSHLVKPFKVHMKRGVIEAVFVDREEPVVITNIKKAMLANVNLDITASRRSSIESNRLQV